MSRALLALLAALAAALALAAPAAAASRYVSLGDSYAAGPLIPVQLPPFGCLKSSNDYGHLTQQQLQFPEYRDPSCSGAKTDHMTAPQGVSPGPNPPQFDSLTADTAMVTLTIGGNDIGFSSIAKDCFVTQPSTGSPCKDKYTAGGQDQISQRIADTAPKVAAVLQGIAARSSQAKTYVVNYSSIFPPSGPGCYPQMPVAEGDVPWLRAKEEELNAMLATQASANGARLVDVYTASRGHDACALPGFRWVEPVTPASPAAPVHPNLIGMQAMASLIAAAARQ
jgi:lysophospholipase L1-like esterase